MHVDPLAESMSPFFCPIAHEIQLGPTLSLAHEPSLYSPHCLASYLMSFKGASPMSRTVVTFADLCLHQAGETVGVSLESTLHQCLQRSAVEAAADVLVSAGFSVDTPLNIHSALFPALELRIRASSVRLTLMAWCVLSGDLDAGDLLVSKHMACVDRSWSRHCVHGSSVAWGADIGFTSDAQTLDPAGSAVEDDAYTRLSCMALALDESLHAVGDDTTTIRWLMQHGAHVNFVHMQQAVSLSSAAHASRVQALLLTFPSVKVNYMGADRTESTFDHLIYRVVEGIVCDHQTNPDEHNVVIAMLFRILDDPVVKRQTLSMLTGCGPHIVRQFHYLNSNPFRRVQWLPILRRLLDMGAVVDPEMLQHALGALPGDRGFPQQHRGLDCRRWINMRVRWPDEVVLALCHSVSPHVIMDGIHLLSRSVLYGRSAPVLTALLHLGASRYETYDGRTAVQWAEYLELPDVVTRLRTFDSMFISYTEDIVPPLSPTDGILPMPIDVDPIRIPSLLRHSRDLFRV